MIMKQEEKTLLLQDLCARLPYGVHIRIEASLETGKDGYDGPLESIDLGYNIFNGYSVMPESVKPYLRPMESMTEEEKEYIKNRWCYEDCDDFIPIGYFNNYQIDAGDTYAFIDWLNKKKFDYRGLIQMGLALPASEGMYSNKH